ncbi:diaminopimelate epimerase [Anaerosacchariphilus polymeriproducens]|uniref:Diaminopimelate epimerase n=1 Tax=Anaerosacchariphilus polymeriproducens TaxID=1812858 RepID=A0A371AUQ6_9FIRM|nr:diaminopimelate epimerase [Anaerosacchariphilus polymeriproducens]RDU23298.1 diaminopimelate epimerase [Anaerosacchariphilus polymeriproducens]
MNTIQLKKYHGLGNDYLVLDPNKNKIHLQDRKIEMICRRNFGVGADGLLYGPLTDEDKIEVKIYNSDGSEAEISGNGVRIFAKYLLDEGYVNEKKFTLTTRSGDVEIEFMDEEGTTMKVSMGKADFSTKKIPLISELGEIVNQRMKFKDAYYNTTCLSLGNPHCIIMAEEVTSQKAKELGPYVEGASCFLNRINMQLLEVQDRDNIKIEIYERGSGYTLASGTSACAAAAAAYRMGLINSKVMVHMQGGSLCVEIMEDMEIFMTGTVGTVGTFTLAEDFFA